MKEEYLKNIEDCIVMLAQARRILAENYGIEYMDIDQKIYNIAKLKFDEYQFMPKAKFMFLLLAQSLEMSCNEATKIWEDSCDGKETI